jgi:hypothetical protein
MDEKSVPAWINLGSLVLLLALVVSFATVIYTAVNAH